MEQFGCAGLLSITLEERAEIIYGVLSISHKIKHTKYLDISLPEDIRDYIKLNYQVPLNDVSLRLFERVIQISSRSH